MTTSALAMDTSAWLDDPSLMRPWFQDASWSAWTAFSKALWGEPMTESELAVYRERTGRTVRVTLALVRPASEGASPAGAS